MPHCTNCGAELQDADKFCTQCGTPVTENTANTADELPAAESEPIAAETEAAAAPTSVKKRSKLPLILALCALGVLILAALIAVGLIGLKWLCSSSNPIDSALPTASPASTDALLPEENIVSTPQTLLGIMEQNTIHSDFVSPTTALSDEIDLYGIMRLSSIVDNGTAQQGIMTADVWGYISHNENGDVFLELYNTPEYSGTNPLLSYFIVLQKDRLTAIIGEEDAWFNDVFLSDKDASGLSATLDNGALYLSLSYDNGQSSCLVEFYVRQADTPWDELCDPCLPGRVARETLARRQGSGLADAKIIQSTYAQLLREESEGITYEQVVSLIGVEGGDGGSDIENNILRYWQAESGEMIYVSFAEDSDGQLIAKTVEKFGF